MSDDLERKGERRLSQLTSAEIELLVNKFVLESADKIADKCVDRIKNAQHDCEAFRIFRDKDNITRFYSDRVEKKIDDHVAIHKKREEDDEKTYNKRHKNTLLFVSLINTPTIYFVVSKLIAKFFTV